MGGIAIIDSGGANIASLLFALQRLGQSAELTTDTSIIQSADRVVLPGVGAAKDAMDRLKRADLVDIVRGLKQPVLGICLGMQLLLEGSEEEDVDCIGVIPGIAERLPSTPEYPVPNMGWCATRKISDHALLNQIENDSYFYFLHSYALPESDYTLATATHAKPFSAVIAHRNFMATQFHPERSSAAGAQLLRNFVNGAA